MSGAPAVGPSTGATYKVMYRRRQPKSGTWGPMLFLAEGQRPRFAVARDGTGYAAWEGDGLMLARLPASGIGKPTALRIAAPESDPSYPSLCLGADGTLFLAWQGREGENPPQVFVTRVPPGPGGGLRANEGRAVPTFR